MTNEHGSVDIMYPYTVVMMKLIEENGMYDAIKKKHEDGKFEDDVYFTEIKNKYIEKNMVYYPIPSIMILLFHYIEIFDNGTIYICCNPEQAEDIRAMVNGNRERLGEFELKVIVGTNIIKFA